MANDKILLTPAEETARLRNLERFAAKDAPSTKLEDDAPKGVSVKSIEVAGVMLEVRDKHGHVWAVPSEDNANFRNQKSRLDIASLPNADPDFAYQMARVGGVYDETAEMLANDWVPVTRDELGLAQLPALAASINAEYGRAPDNFYRIGDQVAFKKPKVLKERDDKAFGRYAAEVAGAMKPQTPDKDEAPHLDARGLVVQEAKAESNFRPVPSA